MEKENNRNEFDEVLGNMSSIEYPTVKIIEDALPDKGEDYPSIMEYSKFAKEIRERISKIEENMGILIKNDSIILEETAKRQHKIDTEYINGQVQEINDTLFGNIKMKLGSFYLVKIKGKKLREIDNAIK